MNSKSKIIDLTEQIEVHLLLFFFLNRGGSGGGRGGTTGTGGGGSDGEGRRISQESLDGLDLLEGVVEISAQSGDVLEAVDHSVGKGGLSGDTDLTGEGGNVGDTTGELLHEELIGEIEDGGIEDGAILVDGHELQTVEKRLDVHLHEQDLFGKSNSLADFQDLDTGDQLNLTFDNLGGDVQSLKHSGGRGIQTGVTSGDVDDARGDDTGLGGGGELVLFDDVTDLVNIIGIVDEDETNVAPDNLNELLQVQFGILILFVSQAGTDHGVLAHEHGSGATELNTHHLHLSGTDEIGMDNQDVGVGLDQVNKLVEVDLLFGGDGGRRHLERYIKFVFFYKKIWVCWMGFICFGMKAEES